MHTRRASTVAASLIILTVSCDAPGAAPFEVEDIHGAARVTAPLPLRSSAAELVRSDVQLRLSLDGAVTAEAAVRSINDGLAELRSPIALHHVEWLTSAGSHEAGQTVFANDRTLRLETRWVPGDPRRNAVGNDLTQFVFGPLAVAFTGSTFFNAAPDIQRSFDTWNRVHCSKLNIRAVSPIGVFPSAILSFLGLPNDPLAADISTIGFVPGWIFDAVLGPGASTNVLGVAFTFVWIDATGQPTDIDGDNRDDTALKEIWYNDDFFWSNSGVFGVDVESVALHENGHALELGHFGRIALNNRTNELQIAPRAAMNAAYLGPQRTVLPTDQAAYCSNFASWPK